MPDTTERGLKRVIGTVVLAATIVNITVGGGIFRLPSGVARALGAAAPIAYIACAVAIALIAICIADAGSRVALTGGPYAYIEVAFGPYVGFLAGVLLWLLGTFAFAAVSVIFAANVGELIPFVGTRGGSVAFLALLFALLALVNIRGVQHGSRLATVATVAKLAPLVILVVLGAFAVRPEHYSVAALPPAGDVARASILLIFAFSGIETALVPSGEVRNTARTVPRAILLAMTTVTVLYVALQLVAQGILGPALAGAAPAPLADAAGGAFAGGRTLLLLGASISMFGYVSGMILAVPRALFAFARDGFLPARLAATHPRYATPHIAIAVQTLVILGLAAWGGFERLAIFSNLSVLLLYALCCGAAWQLRRRGVQPESGAVPYSMPMANVLPWLAIAVIVWLLTSVQRDEWLALILALAIATLMYVIARRRQRERFAVTSGAPASTS
ncbi:MAG: APC family permease [Gemmatimonadaceae bacterium]